MLRNVTIEIAKGMTPLLPPNTLIETSEGELVAQAKAGSAAAFEQLVVRCERRIFRLAQNITRNREDAEDVMQNALIKAFTKLPAFRGDSRFYTWLVCIVKNEALMGMRRRRSTEVSMDDSTDVRDAPIYDEIEDRGPNPEQHYSQHQLQTTLRATLRELCPMYRMVFQLRDVEGFSTRETARALVLSSSAVKTRLRRARFRLRKSLTSTLGLMPAERSKGWPAANGRPGGSVIGAGASAQPQRLFQAAAISDLRVYVPVREVYAPAARVGASTLLNQTCGRKKGNGPPSRSRYIHCTSRIRRERGGAGSPKE